MEIERGADNVAGAPGRIGPAVRAAIDAAAGQPDITTLGPQDARRTPTILEAAPEAVASATQLWIAGPGGPLAVRAYRPLGTAPPPAIVYLHGGGFVLGGLDEADGTCRRLANAAACAVLSVDYRLAPEHPFPAALEDAYAALCWTRDRGSALGIDARRIVVAGSSAGGNLAAAACLLARERGGPEIAMQVLLVPPLWVAHDATESMRANATGYGLEAASMEWFARQYLRTADEANGPLVSPYLAPDLSGLPPAVIVTAEFDPLRDDGELYGKRLREAGVEATVIRYGGMVHGFIGMPGVAEGAAAIDHVGALVRTRLAELGP